MKPSWKPKRVTCVGMGKKNRLLSNSRAGKNCLLRIGEETMKQYCVEHLQSKKEFTDLMLDLLNPLKPFYSEKKALLHVGHTSCGYEDSTVPMEAFARPLWGLAPFWAGGGSDPEFEEIYRRGLAAGTDPKGEEYWLACHDFDQKFVEMAAIAYGILMAPDKVWNPLSEEEKDHLAAWLDEINHYECSYNNWQFFCILVNVALKSQGRPYSQERIDIGLDRIDSYYCGEGWYFDGGNGQKDYYIAFAIHFYSIIYTMFMSDVDPVHCEIFRDRARKFARQFIYWFDEDGSSIPYGRSQTYRFAQMAFFSICAAAKLEVLPLPVLKGIIVRHLVSWMNRPIFDNAGVLTIGYGYPHLIMSEEYNGPGSPYWSMKSFAFLALPDDDPFWSAEAAPLPKLDALKTLKSAEMVVQRIGGHVTAYVPGRTLPHAFVNMEEKYSKFAYSTEFGFSVPRSQKEMREAAPDSTMAFVMDDYVFVKKRTLGYVIGNNEIQITWTPLSGITVKTTIIPTERGHKRIHEVTSEYACQAYDCGFAVAMDSVKEFTKKEEGALAEARNETSFCTVEAMQGNGRGTVLNAIPNSNVLHTKTAIPMVRYDIPKGTSHFVTEITNA